MATVLPGDSAERVPGKVAVVLIASAVYILANLVADVLAIIANPRLRTRISLRAGQLLPVAVRPSPPRLFLRFPVRGAPRRGAAARSLLGAF